MLSQKEIPEEHISESVSGVSKLSRRDFMGFGTAAPAILAAPGLAEAGEQEAILQERYNRSLASIGTDEMTFFREFFDIHSFGDFSDNGYVVRLQNALGLRGDGVIGPATLASIYRQYYAPRGWANLPFLQRTRLEVMYELLPYPSLRRWVGNDVNATVGLYPSSQPQVFHKNYYFGNTPGEPIHGGFINSELTWAFENEQIRAPGYLTVVKRYQGRYVLGVFHNGVLILASYTSPGEPQREGGTQTPRGYYDANRQGLRIDASHSTWITGSDQTVAYEGGRYTSAIMPYVCWIDNNGIGVHAGETNGQRTSLGCLRLPLHYSKGYYDYFLASGESMGWDIRET